MRRADGRRASRSRPRRRSPPSWRGGPRRRRRRNPPRRGRRPASPARWAMVRSQYSERLPPPSAIRAGRSACRSRRARRGSPAARRRRLPARRGCPPRGRSRARGRGRPPRIRRIVERRALAPRDRAGNSVRPGAWNAGRDPPSARPARRPRACRTRRARPSCGKDDAHLVPGVRQSVAERCWTAVSGAGGKIAPPPRRRATPEVPSEHVRPRPQPTTPAPTAEAALSAPRRRRRRRPRGRPQRAGERRARAFPRPASPRRGGACARARDPSPRGARPDQSRAPVSSQLVPAASDISATCSPGEPEAQVVPWGRSTLATLVEDRRRSCAATQAMLGGGDSRERRCCR